MTELRPEPTRRPVDPRPLTGLAIVLVLAACGVAAARAQQEAADAPGAGHGRLVVDVQVPQGTYYVGQGIELRVGVEAAGARPEVVPPKVEGADVSLFRTELMQKGTSAIGDTVNERVFYIWRFRLMPHRAGSLQIPGVVARLGERSGRSRPLRLTIHELPAEGRTSAFLGGVGRLQVDAGAQPSSVRVGQTLEYRIVLDGPAARGSRARPDLAGLDRLPVGLRVEPLPGSAVADPPRREFRFRLRPAHAGEVALPPVPIAYFDPKAAQYFTLMTPSVPIHVADVPAFDPATLAYGDGGPGAQGASDLAAAAARRRTLTQAAFGLVLATAIAFLLAARRLRSRQQADPMRVAQRLVRRLAPGQALVQAEPLARRVTDGLIDYLFAAAGRPRGALTPLEARVSLGAALDRPDLAQSAGELIAACDKARFGAACSLVDLLSLQADAHEFFTSLAELPPRAASANGQPLVPGAKNKGGGQL